MKMLNKSASTVLSALTGGLDVGDARKFGEDGDCFMPVHVDRLSENTYSVAHYYKQNGDMVPDPDMVFHYNIIADMWVPVSIQQWCGHREATVLENDIPTGFYPRELADQVSFANMWMKNIKEQQGGLKTLRKAAA